jgi:hypothetical protein
LYNIESYQVILGSILFSAALGNPCPFIQTKASFHHGHQCHTFLATGLIDDGISPTIYPK